MEALAVFVVLASVAAALFGLVNLVKPLGWLRIRRRRWAAAVIGGSFLTFMIGGLLGAASQPGGLTTGVEAAPADPVAAPKEVSRPAASPRPTGMSQAEFVTVWSAVKVRMESCDADLRQAADAMGGGDPYAAYPVVTRAQQTCQDDWMALRRIPIPRSAKGEARKALIEARERCETTLFVKQDAMERVAKVVNGDDRPSEVSAASSRMEEAGQMNMVCIIGFMSAAEKAGLVLPEFEEAFDAAKDAQD